jgi:hypothetical protein
MAYNGMSTKLWKLTPAPAPKRHKHLGNAKVRAVYESAHLAWRAGAIADFYYGERCPGDATIVWRINGLELAKTAGAEVAALVADAMTARGIVSAAFGETWCGYREVRVTYSNGVTYVERCDGNRVVVDEIRSAA